MEKIEFIKLNSANVLVDNSVDVAKIYDIKANINISDSTVNNIEQGRVLKSSVEVATFSRYGNNNMNITFNNVESTEMCTIITEVNAFCNYVNRKVEEEPINI